MPSTPVSLRRIDHVRFFVGNARQSAYFYRNAFGFDVDRLRRPGNHGQKHEAGYVLRQGNITFVLASPLSAGPSRQPAARSSTATACRTSPSKWTTCAAAYRRGRPPRRRRRRRAAAGAGGRVRRLRMRHHPHLRRHHAHLRQPRPLPAASSPPAIKPHRSGTLQPAHVPAGRPGQPSTTSSATSRKARWTSGSSSTRTCWASSNSSTSTTRTSAPNIRP